MSISSENDYSALNNVVVAIEPPVFERTLPLNKFAATIKLYQEKSVLPSVSIASLIHSSLYMVPTSWYYENEDRYAGEAQTKIDHVCRNRFDYRAIQVLKGKASANHFLVEQLSEFLNRKRAELLVVLGSSRKGVPYWLLGSFAETAALTSTKSVMVIKSQSNFELSKGVRLTVAVDSGAKYTDKDLNWLLKLARPGKIHLDFISVRPKPSGVLSALRKPKQPRLADKDLKQFVQSITNTGLSASLTFLKEKDSIAETVVSFADKTKSWGIVTIATERSFARKLILGSTARRILMLSKRPFFSVRAR